MLGGIGRKWSKGPYLHLVLRPAELSTPPPPPSLPPLFYFICVFVTIFVLLTLNMNPHLPVERVAVWSLEFRWCLGVAFENSKIKIKDYFFFRTSSVFPFFQIVDLELKVRIHWRIWSK